MLNLRRYWSTTGSAGVVLTLPAISSVPLGAAGSALAAGGSGNQYDLALKAAFVPAHASPSVNVSLFPTT
jgi:hypothetical protein